MSFASAGAPVRSRWSDVTIGAVGRAVSYCGDTLAATALALTLQSGGDHGTGVAALLIASALPLAVFGSPAGWLADRVDSRRLVFTTGLLQAGVCSVLAFMHAPVTLVALVALLALGSAVTQPALSALTPEMVTRDDLPKAMSINQTAGTIGMLAGPALGGLLVGAFGARIPLLIDAASFVLLALAVLAIRARRGGRRPAVAAAAAAATTSTVAEATTWTIRGDRLIRTLLISLAAVVASVTAMTVAEVFFVRQTLGSSPAVYGVVASMWELGILAGVWPFARLRGDDNRLVRVQLVVLVLVAVVVLGSATVPAAGWLIPIYLVGGALNAGLNVLVGTIVARRVPTAVRGRVNGTLNAIAAGATLAGLLIGGLVLPHMTPRSLIGLSGAVSLVVALAFLIPAMLTPSVTGRIRPAAAPAAAATVD
jgi:MFS family permease